MFNLSKFVLLGLKLAGKTNLLIVGHNQPNPVNIFAKLLYNIWSLYKEKDISSVLRKTVLFFLGSTLLSKTGFQTKLNNAYYVQIKLAYIHEKLCLVLFSSLMFA